MKPKPFKIGSKIRWRSWILLTPISFLAVACSAHRDNLIAWPKSFDSSSKHPHHCQARLVIHLETPKETVHADATLDFELKGDKSRMKLVLYTPILTPFAKIEVSKSSALWTDENGVRSVSDDPLFGKWFSNDWWKEIAFSLGIVTMESASSVWMNQEHQPVRYEKNNRRMNCEFETFSKTPKSCEITDQDLSGSLNFTSVECQSSL